MIKVLSLLLFISFTIAADKHFFQTNITDNWSMSILSGPNNIEKIKGKVYPTSIPTTLHLVLEAAGDIPNPYLKENYPTLKYVSDCNIKFNVNFNVDDSTFSMDHQQLVFEGIDTYSDIYLNEHKILTT